VSVVLLGRCFCDEPMLYPEEF